MRWFLALFAVLALAVGPPAAPAEAVFVADHCGSTGEMAGMDHGSSDKGSAAKIKGCCIMAMATIDGQQRLAGVTLPRAVLAAAPMESLADVRGDVEVPPPRS